MIWFLHSSRRSSSVSAGRQSPRLAFVQSDNVNAIAEADVLVKENPNGLEKDIALGLVKFIKTQPESKIGKRLNYE